MSMKPLFKIAVLAALSAPLALMAPTALAAALTPAPQASESPEVADSPLFRDATAPLAARVDDLVARLTPEEKVAQLMHAAPAVPRLGIPQYNYWSEALHGVARAGIATVFPQAIALAATFDQAMMLEVATAISSEARAKHHDFASEGKRNIYQGLTLWSPNINIFRDPRWGRGQETYGEDPHLTARMGVNFIKGLQGDDPKYLKTVATAKHFAVHSGPEPVRHSFDARTNPQNLYNTYLPQFEAAVREAGVASVMCAYNRYNGEPACASELLMKDTLRNAWKFDGFVVSDCWAIKDIYADHKTEPDAAHAAAAALKMGTDLNCGDTFAALTTALEQKLITEADLDRALKRLFTARMKLGLFDPPEQVSYTKIPYSVVNSTEHQQLALEAARKAIVLLKNDRNSLPLSKDIKRLAVIGPNADQWLSLLGNYNGSPADPVTPLEGIRTKLGAGAQVDYAPGAPWAEAMPLWETVPTAVLRHGDKAGLEVKYFNNLEWRGKPVGSELHATLNSNWRDGAPLPALDEDHFSARWEGVITPAVSGKYLVGAISTCNTKVYLDGEQIVHTPYHVNDEYGDPRVRRSEWLELEAGRTYQLRVDAVETYADAQVELVWAPPRGDLQAEAVELAKNAEAVVMVMGLSPQLEGEEMEVEVPGFNGGDRTDLELPKVQRELIKAIMALKKPTVLVTMNGSALALNYADQHVPAIVELWYPGQAGGTALADVLFGDYNPAGRLPITFYKSVKDLPPFENYNLTQQTYRFFGGEPLYPFGYGLSYSQFAYSDFKLDRNGDGVTVSATVTNRGPYAGDEVTQVYVAPKPRRDGAPIRQLAGFERVHLAPGASQKLEFELPQEAFVYYNAAGRREPQFGNFEISVGGGQPRQTRAISSQVLTKNFDYQRNQKP